MAQGTRAEASNAVVTAFAILMAVAALFAVMTTIAFVSRLLLVTPDPEWIGVVALLVVAVILAALYAGPHREDTTEIPGHKLVWFLALSIAAAVIWWLLGHAVPALAPFDFSPLLIGLLVYFLLIGRERRRETSPPAAAADALPAVLTAPAAKPKARSSRPKARTAPKRTVKRSAKKRTAKKRR
jgi:hypothetical protein